MLLAVFVGVLCTANAAFFPSTAFVPTKYLRVIGLKTIQ